MATWLELGTLERPVYPEESITENVAAEKQTEEVVRQEIQVRGIYASAAREKPARLGNEALHVGKALLPEVERHVDDVGHKAKCLQR